MGCFCGVMPESLCWVQVDVGSGYGLHEHSKQPADGVAANWMLGKPAAIDFTVTSPLVSKCLPEVNVTAGSAAIAAEERKHRSNDTKCAKLIWVSIPLALEMYGCWGTEVRWASSQQIGHKTELPKVHSHRSFIWEAEPDAC